MSISWNILCAPYSGGGGFVALFLSKEPIKKETVKGPDITVNCVYYLPIYCISRPMLRETEYELHRISSDWFPYQSKYTFINYQPPSRNASFNSQSMCPGFSIMLHLSNLVNSFLITTLSDCFLMITILIWWWLPASSDWFLMVIYLQSRFHESLSITNLLWLIL